MRSTSRARLRRAAWTRTGPGSTATSCRSARRSPAARPRSSATSSPSACSAFLADGVTQLRTDLEQFFHPDGVAILGRVDRSGDASALIAQYQEQYGTDRVYLVNPKGGSVGDVPIYESVVDIPDPVGLAIINVSARFCADALDECGRKGIPYALIFTAGFSEVGPDG